MWLFEPNIARLRKTCVFIVKIESHRDHNVSGQKEGRVLKDSDARSHPLLKSAEVDVMVEYKDGKGQTRVEPMSAFNLKAGRLRTGARLAIIRGDRVGEIVIHLKTDIEDARVYAEGTDKKKGFRIKKTHLCVIE